MDLFKMKRKLMGKQMKIDALEGENNVLKKQLYAVSLNKTTPDSNVAIDPNAAQSSSRLYNQHQSATKQQPSNRMHSVAESQNQQRTSRLEQLIPQHSNHKQSVPQRSFPQQPVNRAFPPNHPVPYCNPANSNYNNLPSTKQHINHLQLPQSSHAQGQQPVLPSSSATVQQQMLLQQRPPTFESNEPVFLGIHPSQSISHCQQYSQQPNPPHDLHQQLSEHQIEANVNIRWRYGTVIQNQRVQHIQQHQASPRQQPNSPPLQSFHNVQQPNEIPQQSLQRSQQQHQTRLQQPQHTFQQQHQKAQLSKQSQRQSFEHIQQSQRSFQSVHQSRQSSSKSFPRVCQPQQTPHHLHHKAQLPQQSPQEPFQRGQQPQETSRQPFQGVQQTQQGSPESIARVHQTQQILHQTHQNTQLPQQFPQQSCQSDQQLQQISQQPPQGVQEQQTLNRSSSLESLLTIFETEQTLPQPLQNQVSQQSTQQLFQRGPQPQQISQQAPQGVQQTQQSSSQSFQTPQVTQHLCPQSFQRPQQPLETPQPEIYGPRQDLRKPPPLIDMSSLCRQTPYQQCRLESSQNPQQLHQTPQKLHQKPQQPLQSLQSHNLHQQAHTLPQKTQVTPQQLKKSNLRFPYTITHNLQELTSHVQRPIHPNQILYAPTQISHQPQPRPPLQNNRPQKPPNEFQAPLQEQTSQPQKRILEPIPQKKIPEPIQQKPMHVSSRESTHTQQEPSQQPSNPYSNQELQNSEPSHPCQRNETLTSFLENLNELQNDKGTSNKNDLSKGVKRTRYVHNSTEPFLNIVKDEQLIIPPSQQIRSDNVDNLASMDVESFLEFFIAKRNNIPSEISHRQRSVSGNGNKENVVINPNFDSNIEHPPHSVITPPQTPPTHIPSKSVIEIGAGMSADMSNIEGATDQSCLDVIDLTSPTAGNDINLTRDYEARKGQILPTSNIELSQNVPGNSDMPSLQNTCFNKQSMCSYSLNESADRVTSSKHTDHVNILKSNQFPSKTQMEMSPSVSYSKPSSSHTVKENNLESNSVIVNVNNETATIVGAEKNANGHASETQENQTIISSNPPTIVGVEKNTNGHASNTQESQTIISSNPPTIVGVEKNTNGHASKTQENQIIISSNPPTIVGAEKNANDHAFNTQESQTIISSNPSTIVGVEKNSNGHASETQEIQTIISSNPPTIVGAEKNANDHVSNTQESQTIISSNPPTIVGAEKNANGHASKTQENQTIISSNPPTIVGVEKNANGHASNTQENQIVISSDLRTKNEASVITFHDSESRDIIKKINERTLQSTECEKPVLADFFNVDSEYTVNVGSGFEALDDVMEYVEITDETQSLLGTDEDNSFSPEVTKSHSFDSVKTNTHRYIADQFESNLAIEKQHHPIRESSYLSSDDAVEDECSNTSEYLEENGNQVRVECHSPLLKMDYPLEGETFTIPSNERHFIFHLLTRSKMGKINIKENIPEECPMCYTTLCPLKFTVNVRNFNLRTVCVGCDLIISMVFDIDSDRKAKANRPGPKSSKRLYKNMLSDAGSNRKAEVDDPRPKSNKRSYENMVSDTDSNGKSTAEENSTIHPRTKMLKM